MSPKNQADSENEIYSPKQITDTSSPKSLENSEPEVPFIARMFSWIKKFLKKMYEYSVGTQNKSMAGGALRGFVGGAVAGGATGALAFPGAIIGFCSFVGAAIGGPFGAAVGTIVGIGACIHIAPVTLLAMAFGAIGGAILGAVGGAIIGARRGDAASKRRKYGTHFSADKTESLLEGEQEPAPSQKLTSANKNVSSHSTIHIQTSTKPIQGAHLEPSAPPLSVSSNVKVKEQKQAFRPLPQRAVDLPEDSVRKAPGKK